jgi:hypothetical protein
LLVWCFFLMISVDFAEIFYICCMYWSQFGKNTQIVTASVSYVRM